MKNKPSVFARIKNWFIDMKAELKRVVWPSFKKIRSNTLVVLIFCLVIGVLIWVLDFVFKLPIGWIFNR
ncbi:MAG: preprotein translocase subunit SecE [Ruminococcaceae bacterium]|nr:preprotein translocase subunit SecE [Oscillospiraceae bacterium]